MSAGRKRVRRHSVMSQLDSFVKMKTSLEKDHLKCVMIMKYESVVACHGALLQHHQL